MTDLEAYLIILTGFIVGLGIILIADKEISTLLIRFIMVFLLIQTGFYGIRILSLPFPRNALLAQILYSGYIISYSFYAGSFAGYCATSIFFKEKQRSFNELLIRDMPLLYNLIRFSAGSVFLYSSIGSLFFFNKYMQFFTNSGYSEVFYVFIIVVEFVGGISLIFKRTALYAALFLMCDMLGAIYTHYHNYFSKHLPDPLGNSIPSLITQTALLTIILFALYPEKKTSAIKLSTSAINLPDPEPVQ